MMIWEATGGDLAVYHVPKNASRTLLAWLICMKEPDRFRENPDWFKAVRHASEGEYHQLRKLVDIHDKRHDWHPDFRVPRSPHRYRICVVRDPVERFVSGYTNRVLFHRNLGSDPPSFGEFTRRFDHYRSSSQVIAGHFLPQCAFLGTSPETFTRVYRIDELEECRRWMEQKFLITLPPLHLQQSVGVPRPQPTEAQRAFIRELHACDYQHWGSYFDSGQ